MTQDPKQTSRAGEAPVGDEAGDDLGRCMPVFHITACVFEKHGPAVQIEQGDGSIRDLVKRDPMMLADSIAAVHRALMSLTAAIHKEHQQPMEALVLHALIRQENTMAHFTFDEHGEPVRCDNPGDTDGPPQRPEPGA